MDNLKNHWDTIYATKKSNEVSWTEDVPATSLNFIHSFNISRDASIIDIGGGESKLVDFLLKEGFKDITVLDISEQAIKNAQTRLGNSASQVKWIVSDITEFRPTQHYDIWHDRATFHFLTTQEQIEKYVRTASESLGKSGFMTIGTFSENGPEKCSGLRIRQYSEINLELTLGSSFNKIRCIQEDHVTPFNTIQNFLFCSFSKKVA
jgi:2-polyprenyl-3-methyl-5-hydroxy-6-metoxy-1,4-benzoquinol methylase